MTFLCKKCIEHAALMAGPYGTSKSFFSINYFSNDLSAGEIVVLIIIIIDFIKDLLKWHLNCLGNTY